MADNTDTLRKLIDKLDVLEGHDSNFAEEIKDIKRRLEKIEKHVGLPVGTIQRAQPKRRSKKKAT